MEKFFYRVENKDTVFSVCQKFQIPPTVLIKLNGLNKEISCGDLLYIEKPACKTYKVKPFDTVELVAKELGLNKTELLEKNGLEYLFYGISIIY